MRFVVEDAFSPSSVRWPDPAAGPWEVTIMWRPGEESVDPMGLVLLPADSASTEKLSRVLLRDLPLGRLVDAARAQRITALGGNDVEGLSAANEPSAQALADEIGQEAEYWRQRRPGRPVTLDDEHYREIARIYDDALANPVGRRSSPVKAIADAKQVEMDTAARWVEIARDKGFLPPTTQGRARGNVPS